MPSVFALITAAHRRPCLLLACLLSLLLSGCSHQNAAPPVPIRTKAIKASKRRTTLLPVCVWPRQRGP